MITIKKPGLLTTIQDLGRHGFQRFGVIAGGAMDTFAHRIANFLVGNDENAPTIEITMLGPVIEFDENALISICGGDLSPMINGKPVRSWRTIFVKKGSELRFGSLKSGCRANLAIAGGLSIPSIMGSKSTYLRAGIGGFHGRSLQMGDQIPFGLPNEISAKIMRELDAHCLHFFEMEWSVTSELIPNYKNSASIRVIKGRQYHLFTEDSRKNFFSNTFEVTTQSDRMGYRLKGEPLSLEYAQEILSEAVNFGTIQVPSDGNPIILLADRQTTGGYPKIGQVASVDLPRLAQMKPGDQLRFSEITNEQAFHLLIEKEKEIQQLKKGILLKFREVV
ncbi:biotin-dependent carboxyltransferase family protein [Heyndrickxia oleronia]|uniref:5-oxoprolinase subunit C family protein n=1 Tax=Heyndrickxia oleronia TaxID=38875 RepID=UPI0020412D19|nr:biotin-dependent carboxyltransferase family protein [Heyndrickxia oleronia]MCM3240281.1 biotin-dependent carboxyltransferase family protein [Heyndrickxia oleronia]